MADRLLCLAITAPGLAPLAARELLALGMAPDSVDAEGVSFRASPSQLYAANLWLRTATRVVVRIATFHADTFSELERRASRVAWSAYISPGADFRIRVTCRKSRLYHSDAVAERIALAVRRAGGAPSGGQRPESPESIGGEGLETDERESAHDDQSAGQLIMVRLYRDACAISIDASGALLHRRGYRQESAKAPLRETLAAALLMTSGWDAKGPLLDPMCGSGTIVIEAALLARRRAPGIDRAFAFMQWPDFDRGAWQNLVEHGRDQEERSARVRILGSDRDAGGTAAAVRNATRAGVLADIDIATHSLSAIDPPQGPGWVVTNPPYGVRVGDRDRLRNLYAQFGHVVRERCAGWTIGMVSASRPLTRHTQLPFAVRLTTSNGGLPVELVRAEP